LSDQFGRKSMFIVEMIIFTAFLGAAVFCNSFISLVICLFGLGLALGCDYPTAHMIISENIPSTSRGKLVLGAFAFQAVGALAGTAVGYAVLVIMPNLNAWRWMYATAVIPALLVTIGRFYITESANWLHSRGSTDRATLAAEPAAEAKPAIPVEYRPIAASGRR
jgi:putative MFS transporter